MSSGVPPDPSYIVVKQLGLKLTILNDEVLPIYDAVTGEEVPKDVDDYVERVREELLDKAIAVAKDRKTYDDDTLALNFGAEMERCLAEREQKASVRVCFVWPCTALRCAGESARPRGRESPLGAGDCDCDCDCASSERLGGSEDVPN